MFYKSVLFTPLLLVVAGIAAAEELDAVINDGARGFTKQANSPDKFFYGRVTLDSQGNIVHTFIKEGKVTRQTKIAMGKFNERKKQWLPGEAIEGGVGADLFTETGKVLRVRITLADDKTTIKRILVTKTEEEGLDAVINDGTRGFTKQANSPDKFFYGRVTLDSQGNIVHTFIKEGKVTRQTEIAMGKFNERKKQWLPGEPIEGGVGADLFTETGKVLRVRITLADDKTTIKRILVTKTEEKAAAPAREFDAIYKNKGLRTNGRGPISFVRIERDRSGKVINKFGLQTGLVTADTKYVMGKYNEAEKKWEAGDEIANGLDGDLLKDPGAKTIYVHITLRDDRRGIAQFLVTQIGEQAEK